MFIFQGFAIAQNTMKQTLYIIDTDANDKSSFPSFRMKAKALFILGEAALFLEQQDTAKKLLEKSVFYFRNRPRHRKLGYDQEDMELVNVLGSLSQLYRTSDLPSRAISSYQHIIFVCESYISTLKRQNPIEQETIKDATITLAHYQVELMDLYIQLNRYWPDKDMINDAVKTFETYKPNTPELAKAQNVQAQFMVLKSQDDAKKVAKNKKLFEYLNKIKSNAKQ